MIGYYYSEDGLFNLYKTNMFAYTWVTNICYYDSLKGRYYSPNMKNLLENGRNLRWQRFNVEDLTKNVVSAHSSFVLR